MPVKITTGRIADRIECNRSRCNRIGSGNPYVIGFPFRSRYGITWPQNKSETAPVADAEPDEPANWDDTFYPGQIDPAEFFWSQISEADKAYLAGARIQAAPCPWCGGRLHHTVACEELRTSWEVALPFGKHKGKPLGQVPRDYLTWLVGNSSSLSVDLREAIGKRLRPG